MVGNIWLSRAYPSEVVEVEKIHSHENYDINGRKFDLALLKV